MTDETHPPTDASPGNETTGWKTRLLVRLIPALAALTLFIGTAAAQSPGQSFCNTDMAQTIQNVFTTIQFGGPMLGGVLGLGATVVLPFVRRSDWKKEMKEIRNQGLLWGVVAPLGTQIIALVLNDVVAGGTPAPSEGRPSLAAPGLEVSVIGVFGLQRVALVAEIEE